MELPDASNRATSPSSTCPILAGRYCLARLAHSTRGHLNRVQALHSRVPLTCPTGTIEILVATWDFHTVRNLWSTMSCNEHDCHSSRTIPECNNDQNKPGSSSCLRYHCGSAGLKSETEAHSTPPPFAESTAYWTSPFS
nr:hypothetical protein Iba_chr03eCG7840 [Ipomoea batatas]